VDNPAIALAELMNQRQARLAVEPSLGAPQQNRLASNGRSLAEEQARPRRPAGGSGLPAAATIDDDKHIEAVAALVCGLLGAKVKSLLTRKLRAWPHVLEDADDLGQLAALAFVEGYRQGKVKPDAATQQHTASSVSAYMWGICNHIFIDTLRRNRRAGEPREIAEDGMSGALQDSSPLDRILPEAPEEDDESRLWSVLATVRNRCHPQDIVMTYLMGCGFKSGEVRRLLEVSINLPAIAVRRVGQAVREILGLNSATRQEELQIEDRNHQARNGGVNPGTGGSANPAPLPTLELLKGKYFAELVQRLDSPSARNMFLREAVAALGPAEQLTAEQLLADRQSAIRADGDWSWGLLSARDRRELLTRNARLLRGAGYPDEGKAQKAALKELVANLRHIFKDLDQALLEDDLDWLLPISESLSAVLGTIGEFKEMQQRYRLLLETAQRLGSPRLEMLAQLPHGYAIWTQGDIAGARESLKRTAALARVLNEPRQEAKAEYFLGGVEWAADNCPLAQEHHERCLSICRARGYRRLEARAIGGMAKIHYSLCEYDISEQLQRQALKIMREVGDCREEARCLVNIAVTQLMKGDLEECVRLLHTALEINSEIGDRDLEITALYNLAICHDGMGDFVNSAAVYGQCLTPCALT
jgi:tetratricopeptide (TPR) repeat protein/DNA-directed RNA polymerase specialized sigma24 family protein